MLSRPFTGDDLTGQVIGLAIEVHRALGPGLLESICEECLCAELMAAGLPFARRMALPVSYKGRRLDCGYRLDLVVKETVVVEIKSVEQLQPVQQAQLLTYMKIQGYRRGCSSTFTRHFSETASAA